MKKLLSIAAMVCVLICLATTKSEAVTSSSDKVVRHFASTLK